MRGYAPTKKIYQALDQKNKNKKRQMRAFSYEVLYIMVTQRAVNLQGAKHENMKINHTLECRCSAIHTTFQIWTQTAQVLFLYDVVSLKDWGSAILQLLELKKCMIPLCKSLICFYLLSALLLYVLPLQSTTNHQFYIVNLLNRGMLFLFGLYECVEISSIRSAKMAHWHLCS